MPLKVSSQGWVKVAPPPKRERKRVVDPEEQKETLCAPLRYFACQALDPSRERLRMLHGRAGFSSSEVNLLRPVSRLEKSSTLDQWRFDTQPPRSSSRQSGDRGGSGSGGNMPNGYVNETKSSGSWLGNKSKNKDEDILSWTGSIQQHDNEERRSKRHERSSRAHEDDQSVASGGSRGSKGGREKKSARSASAPVIISASPSVISEEESQSVEEMVEVEEYADNASVAYTETPSERQCRHKHRHRRSHNTPTTIAEEDESQRDLQPIPTPVSIPIPQPQPQPIQIPIYIPTYVPTPLPGSASIPSPVSTSTPAPAATPARSETYRSRRSESSYAPSTRSSSPVRSEYDPLPIPRVHKSRRAPSEASGVSYSPRDRVATDPISRHRPSAPASTSSRSSYSTYTSETSSSISKSSKSSHDSTPSMNDYKFQAAIFQPKSNYRGYRAPSLSKGNRWETATSALSFE